jgi:glucokinase
MEQPRVRAVEKISLGLDIGASNIRICAVDEDGKVVWRVKRRLDLSTPPSSIVRQASELLRGRRLTAYSAGVGVAGFVSTPRGEVLKMPNAGVESFPASEMFSRVLGKKPIIVNDAVAAVYGEYLCGNIDKDILYLTFSTGIGGAAMLSGRIVAGREGNSHEVGHLVVDVAGRLRCGCGGRGHWESYCSGSGLPRFASFFLSGKKRTSSSKAQDPRADEIFRLYSEGEMDFVRFMKEVIALNSAGLASVINIYRPDEVIIGGAVALSNWDVYIEGSLKKAAPLTVCGLPHVRRSKLGDYATAYGAAVLSRSTGIL